MADFDNLSTINENFDTIKTLLNSIRAQGILNTSDVDKLLTGIHAKIEKLNTEEDIDLIKIFLSELKQNLDERHSILVSKFGAIESLFTNLLKNSSEMPKSAELKELFDIVATNLSVFSREVVSQKETLSDITLRLDALRSDDSQKKDIIKNITLLRPDLERLNNGFDSIVLSLNDNFKTIIKTITTIDKTEHLDKFADTLAGIEMSSNTILSAIQMLDKKTVTVEDSLKNLATKEDVTATRQKIFELVAQGHELTTSLTDLSERYVRIDNLAEKIDASVNIIASLKSLLEETGNNTTRLLIEEINKLEAEVHTITTDTRFEEFRLSLESIIGNIADNIINLDKKNSDFSAELKKISDFVNSLDVGAGFQNVLSNISKSENEIKTYIDDSAKKQLALEDANITRVLNDISSNADLLGSKLNQAQASISVLCEKNFGTVFSGISDLKNVVAQIDENSVSANNAIFSSITDRLTVFENSLRTSLDVQERTICESSAQLVEQVDNIKNLSNVIDYKMDSSVVEVNNIKREFGTLKTAVEEMLALDFINTVKDLRVDLYASKQEVVDTIENSTSDLSEKFTNDIYGKYELLISKLDNVEDEFKKTQASTLSGLKGVLENISSSIVDVLSYVSEQRDSEGVNYDAKLSEISNTIKETSLNYVENVRDIVDIIRVQVETNLKNIEEENLVNFDSVKKSISDSSADLKKELKYSYSKLLEIQDSYKEIKEILNVNNLSDKNKFDDIIASAEVVKSDFETKLNSLRTVLLEKITDFKQEFTCENADKVSELKFSVETHNAKTNENINTLMSEIKTQLTQISTDNTTSRAASLSKILDNFIELKDLINSLNTKAAEDLSQKVEIILADFSDVKTSLDRVDTTIDEDLTRQLSIIESNFETLVSQITILFEKSEKDLAERINREFSLISDDVQDMMTRSLEQYKSTIEQSLDSLHEKSTEQTNYLQDRISELNEIMKKVWEDQSESNFKQLSNLADNIKNLLDENAKLSAADYEILQENLSEFSKNIEQSSQAIHQSLKTQIQNIAETIEVAISDHKEQSVSEYENLLVQLNTLSNNIETKNKELKDLSEDHFKLAKSTSIDTKAIAELLANNHNVTKAIKDLCDATGTDITALAEALATNTELEEGIKTILESNLETSEKTHKDIRAMGLALGKALTNNDNTHEELRKLLVTDIEQTEQIDNKVSVISENLISNTSICEETKAKAYEIESEINSISETLTNNLATSQETKVKAYEIGSEINSISETLTNNLATSQETKAETETILTEVKTNAETLANNLNVSQEIKLETEEISTDIKMISEVQANNTATVDSIKASTEEQLELAKSASLELAGLNLLGNEQSEKLEGIENDIKTQMELAKNSNAGISVIIQQGKEHVDKTSHVETYVKQDIELTKNIQTELSALNILCADNGSKIDQIEALTQEQHEQTKFDIASLAQDIATNKNLINTLENALSEKVVSLRALTAEISAGELQALDAHVDNLYEQIEAGKENVKVCKDILAELIKQELKNISANVEKETDTIIAELIEQFDLLKDSQADDIVNLTSRIEEIINAHIYNNIEDLKSYLDIKTDNSVLSSKLDNLKSELSSSVDSLLSNLNKMLDSNVFTSALSDFRVANEILVSSTADRLNEQIENFVKENTQSLSLVLKDNNKNIEDKLALFDKKFVDTLVDKYEEIKLVSNKHNNSLQDIRTSINGVLSEFSIVKSDIGNKIDELVLELNNTTESTTREIRLLSDSFENLRSQISNKSFDEAFQASINKQIASLETLVIEQLGYIEDINELCANNLPDVSELNTLVKHSVLESVKEFSEKLDSQDIEGVIEKELKETKSEIITQLINIFNQISFVAEQEEILDFIQEKHDELITVLSHIVTTANENIEVVNEKIDSLKDDINCIYTKINSIISSEDDVDYIYSLHDLESDIANLRLALNEMKGQDHGEEFEQLISSTNEIYGLVESIKTELPSKKDFESMAEDIISISTRTNKLILASDESYKTLQDNLEDFKLVIDDLDERTRNFAQESGLDRIDNKLNALNSMIQNGSKTNQVFNQVFEYLAEWVDNASVQINTISDRIETLDEISQIKTMIEDLKAGSEDNTESIELVEALGTVFDKQTKRISSLETKLDKIIVETTINNKFDITPIEQTLNKFLVAMEEKFSSQQNKINSLETKLESVMNLLDEKDTAQLTKKVGGMDRQIAKLNKSIEKIASHVVEK